MQANAANASLSAEVQQLQATLEEISVRLTEAQSAAKVAADDFAVATGTMESLRYYFTTIFQIYVTCKPL